MRNSLPHACDKSAFLSDQKMACEMGSKDDIDML